MSLTFNDTNLCFTQVNCNVVHLLLTNPRLLALKMLTGQVIGPLLSVDPFVPHAFVGQSYGGVRQIIMKRTSTSFSSNQVKYPHLALYHKQHGIDKWKPKF